MSCQSPIFRLVGCRTGDRESVWPGRSANADRHFLLEYAVDSAGNDDEQRAPRSRGCHPYPPPSTPRRYCLQAQEPVRRELDHLLAPDGKPPAATAERRSLPLFPGGTKPPGAFVDRDNSGNSCEMVNVRLPPAAGAFAPHTSSSASTPPTTG